MQSRPLHSPVRRQIPQSAVRNCCDQVVCVANIPHAQAFNLALTQAIGQCANSIALGVTRTGSNGAQRTCRGNGADELYTYAQAYADWAPYTALSGYYGDSSRGRTPTSWPHIIDDGSGGSALEATLPRGCTGAKCTLQAKTLLAQPVEAATLKYRCGAGVGMQACATCMMAACTSGRWLRGVYTGIPDHAHAVRCMPASASAIHAS